MGFVDGRAIESVENGEVMLRSVDGGRGRASRAETVDSDALMVRLRAHSGLSSGFRPFCDCAI